MLLDTTSQLVYHHDAALFEAARPGLSSIK